MLVLSLPIALTVLLERKKYPLFAPSSLEDYDYKVPPPGKSKGYSKAKGISYLGHDEITNMPVYSTNDVDRQHKFSLATTGGGKTQNFIAVDIGASAMIQASGFLSVDGKSTIDALLQTYGVMRRFLREQDLIVINFMKGNKDFRVKGESITTNSFNPLKFGASTQISELLKPLLGDTSSGNSDVWRKRAESFLDAQTLIFCYLRDVGVLKLSIQTYRDYLSLPAVIRLAHGRIDNVTEVDIPEDITDSMFTFLKTIAGLTEGVIEEVANGNEENLTETAGEQFNFISMQIAPMLNIMATDYGHIFNHKDADVDLEDIVLNRRGLLVLLPSLEYSESTVLTLAQIVVSAIKGMMAKQLGSEVEGSPKEMLAKRAFAAPAAFRLLFDEVTYYLTSGMDLIAAQGRGLGVATSFGTQELGAAKKRNDIVTSAIWGSTNLKVLGKIEDADTSLDMISKRLGQVNFSQINNYSVEVDEHGSSHIKEPQSIGLERREQLDIKDLADQREGEQYLTYGSQVIKLRGFFIPEDKYMADKVMLNQFVAVGSPSDQEVELLRKGSFQSVAKRLNGIIKGEIELPEEVSSEPQEKGGIKFDSLIKSLKAFDALKDTDAPQLDRAICAVQTLVEDLKKSKGTVKNNAAESFKEMSKRFNSEEESPPESSTIEDSLKALNSPSVIVEFDYGEIDESSDYEDEEFDSIEPPTLNDYLQEDPYEDLTPEEVIENTTEQIKKVGNVSGQKMTNEQETIVDLIIHEALEHPKPPVPNYTETEAADKLNQFLNKLSHHHF
ncbi:MAG: TraM recognition domain-containing protein [Pseudomonadota bacterium]|nr:TraM recognition domain-containing protein [Pseudomonadota bacterium]